MLRKDAHEISEMLPGKQIYKPALSIKHIEGTYTLKPKKMKLSAN